MMDRHNSQGITLVELILVLTIIGILIIAFGFSYVGWRGNYNIETTTKSLYGNLMEVRTQAMTRNMTYYVWISPLWYLSVEDTNNSGWIDGGDAWMPMKQVSTNSDYQLKSISGVMPLWLVFDKRGSIQLWGGLPANNIAFGIDSASLNLTPDIDCISINAARLHMGKNNGTRCVEQ